VADPGGQLTDSIQIAEIEPLYSAKETNVAAFGMVVSAQGEHPPLETAEKAFDGTAISSEMGKLLRLHTLSGNE